MSQEKSAIKKIRAMGKMREALSEPQEESSQGEPGSKTPGNVRCR